MANPLIPFLLAHAAAGVAAGWITLAGLLWLDVGRLWSLIRADEAGAAALLLLAGGFAVTFASAAMGAGIMGLGRPPRPASGVRARSGPAPARAKAPPAAT